jgi:prevent-host-death family protein
MRMINVHEAKTQLSRLLDDVRDGEEIILAKAGEPYARLVPIGTPSRRELGFLPGLLGTGDAVLEPLDDETLASFESDL